MHERQLPVSACVVVVVRRLIIPHASAANTLGNDRRARFHYYSGIQLATHLHDVVVVAGSVGHSILQMSGNHDDMPTFPIFSRLGHTVKILRGSDCKAKVHW